MTAENPSLAVSQPPIGNASVVASDALWSDVMTKRIGAPPLRFKGRVLSHIKNDASKGHVAITLWKRKTKGFAAAVAVGDSVSSSSSERLEDVMTWLEQYCNDFASVALPDAAVHPIIGHFNHIAVERVLRIVAGRALDRWDLLSKDGADDDFRKDTA